MPIDSKRRAHAGFAQALPRSAFALVLLGALGACSGGGENGGADDGASGIIEITDANNYASESALNIPSVETATGEDLDICWGDVADDLQCHEVNEEAPLVTVSFLRLLNVSQRQAQDKIASGELEMADVNGYLVYPIEEGESCMKLTDFTLRGSQVDIFEEYVEAEELTYLLLFSDSTSTGVGTRTMVFLDPRDDATNTTVDAPSGCGDSPLLDFEVDIATAEPVPVPAEGPWNVEWRNLAEDSTGQPVPYVQIDRLMLAFYEGLSVRALEEQIFDIELIATRVWEHEHESGKAADLSQALDRETGEPFDGFETDEEGTWLLALLCGSCQNPAPILLTVLEPEET
jgi:hypothetical protein